jgi:hypothetical protein
MGFCRRESRLEGFLPDIDPHDYREEQGKFMDVDVVLRRHGLRPAAADLDHIRGVLRAQTELEQHDQDTELMRVCCVQLFNSGQLGDVLTIWAAKVSSWDAHCAIDVQLLCGAGLDATGAYLAAEGSGAATEALTYLRECVTAGDFDDFSVAGCSHRYDLYHLGGEPGPR